MLCYFIKTVRGAVVGRQMVCLNSSGVFFDNLLFTYMYLMLPPFGIIVRSFLKCFKIVSLSPLKLFTKVKEN